MEDIININKELFNKWIEMFKSVSYGLKQYLAQESDVNLFETVCTNILKEYNANLTMTNFQLTEYHNQG